jgi:deoxyadenosine/deoxycytidine kinase
MRTLVCVEGGIGAGKSTCCKAAAELVGCPLELERVDEWIAHKYEGDNLLSAMYRGALSKLNFQLAIFPSRVAQIFAALHNAGDKGVVLTERSPWSEREIFARPQLADKDFKLYLFSQLSTINPLLGAVGPLRVIFVHMDVPVDTAMARIAQRGRAEEKRVTTELMQSIESAHTAMQKSLASATDMEEFVHSVEHVRVDGDRSVATIAKEIAAIVRAAQADAV